MQPDQLPPLARWNPTRDCWETTQVASLFSEHLDVYSETWPNSGSMRNGIAYERPTSALPTAAPAISSSPSPAIPPAAPRLQDAYAAGLIDGEGCLHLTKNGKKQTSWAAKATINMTIGALPVLQAMQQTYGGGLCRLREQTEKYQEVWLWSLTARAELKLLLTAVLPYLMVKRRQAEVILEYLEQVESAPRNARGTVVWDQAMRDIGAAAKAQITRLNARGAAAIAQMPAQGALLPTPSASLGVNGGSQPPDKRRAGGHSVQLHDVIEHL